MRNINLIVGLVVEDSQIWTHPKTNRTYVCLDDDLYVVGLELVEGKHTIRTIGHPVVSLQAIQYGPEGNTKEELVFHGDNLDLAALAKFGYDPKLWVDGAPIFSKLLTRRS